jgi:hypothetical protein
MIGCRDADVSFVTNYPNAIVEVADKGIGVTNAFQIEITRVSAVGTYFVKHHLAVSGVTEADNKIHHKTYLNGFLGVAPFG